MIKKDRIHTHTGFLARFENYMGEFVYGGMDGAVTTFAVVAGAFGAGIESSIVIILGFANLLADGLSMSIGAYLSIKTEKDHYDKHRQIEYYEVETIPETEREEIREIYRLKGFEGELLEQIVAVITSDKDRWVDEMMKDELEMIEEVKSSFKIGLVTYISFLLMGFIPLLAYVIDFFSSLGDNLFLVASVLTGMAFITVGALKAYVNQSNYFKAIAETVILGAVAAIVAYYVGGLIEGIVR